MTVIIDDRFNDRTNNEALSGTSPDTTDTPGTTWQENAFGAFAGDGSGAIDVVGSGRWAQISTGLTDDAMAASVDFNARGGDNRMSVSLMGEDSTDDNEYRLNVRDTTVHLLQIVAGSSTELASTSQSRNQSTTYNYKIEHDPSASTLKCYRDDVEITALTQTSFSPHASLTGQSFIGFRHDAYTGSGGLYDNFVGEDLDAGGGGGLPIPVAMHHYTKNMGQ